MAAFMHHNLTVQAFVSRPAQAPYPVLAHFTQSCARESLRLVFVSIDEVNLAPSPRSSPINASIFASALRSRPFRYIGEYVHNELALLIQVVKPQRFVQLDLAAERARIAFFVDPLDCEQLLLVKFAYISE